MKTRLLGFVKKRLCFETAFLAIYGGLLGWTLFKNVLMVMICSILMALLSIFMPDKSNGKRQSLRQVADLLESMAGSISSGHSLPKAIQISCSQTREMYASMGVRQVVVINVLETARLVGDTSGTSAFGKVGETLDNPEIKAFAKALHILEKKGGNIARLCLDTCDGLRSKCDLQEEIETIRTDMDLSRRVLLITVPLVVLFIGLMAPDFMASIYVGKGRLVAIAIFITICVSWAISRKICEIR